MRKLILAVSLPLALAACSGDDAADNNAAALERAAEQSGPEAADLLRNAADEGADVQGAMQQAGNAQAPTPAPPAVGARPHAPGDPVPPPKVPADAGANSQ
jgi:hypothetical protein